MRTNHWTTLAALSAGYFLVLFDQGFMPVVTPLLPFEVTNSVWLTSMFLLFSVAPMPAAGRLGDAFGHRRMFLLGLAITAAGLILAGSSWSFAALVVARAAQGLGVALFLPQAFAVLPKVFPEHLQGRAFAAWGVIGSVASLLGPIAGGAIAQSQGWRAAFFVQAAMCVGALLAAAVWVPQLPKAQVRVPVLGVLLSFAGLGSLVYGIQYSGWYSVLFGALCLALLVLAARNGQDNGFLPLYLLRDRTFAFGTIAIFAMGFSVASMFIPMMYWLQTVAGASPTMSGFITAPMSVVAFVATPIAGYLSDKGDPRRLCVAGFAVQAIAIALVIALILGSAQPAWFGVSTALLGLGSAFVWAPNAALTMRGIPEADAGAASGLYNTSRQVGSVLGVALVGAVLATGEIAGTAAPAMALPLAAFLVGVLSALLLSRTVGNPVHTASVQASR
ncbi:Multidrug resistance protein stp [Corynebacterium glaucum]|uniref:MFS transporter n=1 Tax=Corynebacterium glaucum TaxID=187491 RepID=UPI0025B2FC3C|nr:MFS transporter [Corynebacterium glaucum]WJZ07576.1 Multidrug resistance protein stp [Corynebacterium glaucum]